MRKVALICIGKANKYNDPWMLLAIQEYEKRLSRGYVFSYQWFKTQEELMKFFPSICSSGQSKIFALDAKGSQFDSQEWSEHIEKIYHSNGSTHPIIFLIGGPDGYSNTVNEYLDSKHIQRISFSKFTFTHQMIRVILMEQMYRAYCIKEGIPYHK